MSIIKRADVKEHFASKRRLRVQAARRARQGDSTASGDVAQVSDVPPLSFVEDFSLEHSSKRIAVTSFAAGPAENEAK